MEWIQNSPTEWKSEHATITLKTGVFHFAVDIGDRIMTGYKGSLEAAQADAAAMFARWAVRESSGVTGTGNE